MFAFGKKEKRKWCARDAKSVFDPEPEVGAISQNGEARKTCDARQEQVQSREIALVFFPNGPAELMGVHSAVRYRLRGVGDGWAANDPNSRAKKFCPPNPHA